MSKLQKKLKYEESSANNKQAQILKKMRKDTLAICSNLCSDGEDFEQTETINLLYDYIINWDRISYASISDFIFKLTEEERTQMIVNAEKMYAYTFSEDFKSQVRRLMTEKETIPFRTNYEYMAIIQCAEMAIKESLSNAENSQKQYDIRYDACEQKIQKIVMKILDHINLANSQFMKLNHDDEYFERKIAPHMEGIKKEIAEKINDNSKDNMNQLLSLIGIFTALSFIVFGSLTSLDGLFSQIQETHTLKLVLIGSLWGLAVFNLLSVFEYFVSRVAGKRFKYTDKEDASFYEKYPLVLIGNTVLGTAFLISAWLYFIALEDLGGTYLTFVQKHISWMGVTVIILIFAAMCFAVYILRLKKTPKTAATTEKIPNATNNIE